MSVVVPVIGLKLDSRTEFDSAGRFRRFEAQVYDAAGDSLRGTYSVTADGDTLRSVSVSQRTGQTASGAVDRSRRRSHPGPVGRGDRAPGAALRPGHGGAHAPHGRRLDDPRHDRPSRRHGRGDAGRHRGAHGDRPADSRGRSRCRSSRLRAELWNGRDSLPALAGLRRPVPDYRAPAGARYTAEEVRVPIHPAQGDTFSLAGTFTLPVSGPTPVPVVVTITGSGRQTRDEDLWPLPARPTARFVRSPSGSATAGIGVLRLDDRGDGMGRGSRRERRPTMPTTCARWSRGCGIAPMWRRRGSRCSDTAKAGRSRRSSRRRIDTRRDRVARRAGPRTAGRSCSTSSAAHQTLTPGLSDSARAAQLAAVPQTVDQVVRSQRLDALVRGHTIHWPRHAGCRSRC